VTPADVVYLTVASPKATALPHIARQPTNLKGPLTDEDKESTLRTMATSFRHGVMTVRSPSSGKIGRRSVRAHRKSRQGCGNCKLRSIKARNSRPILTVQETSTEPRPQCDESKPQCKRCTAYGVFCNYDRKCSDLQFSVERATNITLPQSLPYWPSKNEELLNKFQVRTALTVSTGKRLHLYQHEVVQLAYSVSYS
jgi:hypothetical protein